MVMTKQNPTKIVVARCDIVSEACPAVSCFKAFNERKSHFKTYDINAQIIVFYLRVLLWKESIPFDRFPKKQDLDVVHLSSCMLMKDTYPKCSNLDSIKKTIQTAGIEVVEGTHH